MSFALLRRNRGEVVPTIVAITALVSFASGILDGVSMIGLTIRTLVIILFLARADREDVIYAVLVSTVITTVCGMWLAYGEPPNLIMKANLQPHLDALQRELGLLPDVDAEHVVRADHVLGLRLARGALERLGAGQLARGGRAGGEDERSERGRRRADRTGGHRRVSLVAAHGASARPASFIL